MELQRGAVTGRNFHTYVNPERDMPEGAFNVHGLSEKFLSDKKLFADPDVAAAFVEFVGDAELIAHNGISFDLPFMNAELNAAGMPELANDIVDTLHLARRKFPGSPASLDALCSRFGVSTEEREREGHGALLDSLLLAKVYIELTGGVQAGLDFTDQTARAARRASGGVDAQQRPAPLPARITDEEQRAHEAFVEELGPDSLWARSISGADKAS